MFRLRIFRLLLLFAVIPAIILTALGYYLAQEAPLETERDRGAAAALADHYHNLLAAEIARAVEQYQAYDSVPGTLLDFVVAVGPDGPETRLASTRATVATISFILESATRDEGLLLRDGRYWQYVRFKVDSSRFLLGGMVHDSVLTPLLETVHRGGASRRAVRELRATYATFLGSLFLVVMAVTVMAAFLLSRRMSRRLADPLTALSHAASRIASGDFQQTVAIQEDGEIGQLVAAFNQMALDLESATTRLAQTERVAAWRQVARRFAHELKNPLQPILISLYQIEKQLKGSAAWDQIAASLGAAADEVKHLTALADRFSTLAKLPPPRLADTDLMSLVKSVAQLYHDKLKPYQFALDLPDQPVIAYIDESYLREALHNLLQNSLDACAADDQVTIRLKQIGDNIELSVCDTGAGMDAPTVASARLPYFTTKAKGNGLGLAIVEKSTGELGGQLSVRSKVGQGTTVTLILPGSKT